MQIAHLEYQLDDSVFTQRILRLRVGASDVSAFMDRIALRLRPEVVVPGFRKGKAPLSLVRKAFRGSIAIDALQDIRRTAQEQVFKQLEDKDRPFVPAELLEPEKIRVRYGKELEFALRYLVDPTGLGKGSEFNYASFDPASAMQQVMAPGSTGIPGAPRLPSPPPQLGQARPDAIAPLAGSSSAPNLDLGPLET